MRGSLLCAVKISVTLKKKVWDKDALRKWIDNFGPEESRSSILFC